MTRTIDRVDRPGIEYRVLRRVENTERESLATVWPEEDTYVHYTNEHVRWVGEPGALEPDFHDVIDWGESASSYYQTETLLEYPSAVSVVRRNETALVLSIENTEDACVLDRIWSNADESATTDRGRRTAAAKLYVDLESRRLERFELTVAEPAGGNRSGWNRTVLAVREYSEWDRTEVRRPPSAGYTLREFLLDLVGRVPL